MHLSDELKTAIGATGARLRFRYPWWLRPFLARGVVAITLGRRIYVARELASAELEKLLRHELVHVRQVQRLGLVRFYVLYVVEFFRNLRAGMNASEAYRRISFEVEAFEAEKLL